MRKKRKSYRSDEKVSIIRRHLLDGIQGSDFPVKSYIPFAFKNARFERVDFREGLDVESQE
ncbi:MAG: hypothetical protein V3V31_12485 [Methylococcales bacterium]